MKTQQSHPTSASTIGAPTIGAKLDRLGGSATGFDYLRIGLAMAVVLWHSLEVSYADGTSIRVWHAARGIVSLILPMFFALSGFLVCGSLVRAKSLFVFFSHRAIRLLPALFVEVMLSALILGALLTTLPISAYLQSSEFLRYFLNIIGDIHFRLPGVFADNPSAHIVNRSLWTIPYELECYLSLAVLAVIGLTRRPAVMGLIVLVISVGFTVVADATNSPVLQIVGPPGRLLLLSFLAGLAIYLLKDRITLRPLWFLTALAASIACLSDPHLMFLAAIPAAYVTVWLGMTMPPRIPILMSGDYSYGLYLFAYPLQQTQSFLFPQYRHWWLNAAFGIVFGLCYAAFSWHCIEKQVLARRKLIIAGLEALVRPPRKGVALLWRRLALVGRG